jgi:subtilisin family serine protease
VKVAVIDSGIDYSHKDFNTDNYAYGGGYDFVSGDTDPYDDNGHGTHVAGTVAARDNNIGVVGVAPGASIYALKVLDANGNGYWSDVIAALQWAVDNSIRITNNSYGSSRNPGGIVESAFNSANDADVLSIASAGNEGNCGGRSNSVGYPARFPSVVAVSATDNADNRACFSSTGPDVELAAPGVNIKSTVPNDGYASWNGTSMASPHVAGTAALVISAGIADANLNGRINDEVRGALISTADDLGEPGRDPWYGHGLVDADEAVTVAGPPAPAVNISLSTDKTEYLDTETTSILTALVTDETGGAISGLDPSAFSTTFDDRTTSVIFNPDATEGTYIGALDITDSVVGTHSAEVTVTDTRGESGTGTATFEVVTAVSAKTVSVASIAYASEGGRRKDKHLLITIALVDNLGGPVAGATVSIDLYRDGSMVASSTGVTGTDGRATFKLRNAASGCYTTTVTGVTADGLTWDEATPANGFGHKIETPCP